MQKKLIALAIAGLSSAAFAQSNVTIYGVMDLSFDSVAMNSGATAADTRNSFTRVTSNSSYIGFKGTEDLGDGLKAVFQIEQGLNSDGSATIMGGTSRDTYVGVAGGFGTLVLGNLTSPTRALGGRMEMMPGNTGIGDAVSLVGNLQNVNNTGTTGTFDTRLSNTVAYITPDYNGFNLVIGYMSGENKNFQNAAAANAKAWDIGANYVSGPWDAGITFGKADTGTNTAAALDTNTNTRIGVGYNFGVAKVTAEVNRQKLEYSGSGDAEVTSYSVQGKYSLTPRGSLIASYTRAKDVHGANAAVVLPVGATSTSDSGARMIMVGYLHELSKRTTVKAVVARINNDDNAAYDFSSGRVGAAGLGQGSNVQGVQVGIRHSF